MTNRASRIAALLQPLKPSTLQITDNSAAHAGHSGARPGGETHYHLHIASEAFRGQSRVQRHRMITALLKDEFASGLHALEIRADST